MGWGGGGIRYWVKGLTKSLHTSPSASFRHPSPPNSVAEDLIG